MSFFACCERDDGSSYFHPCNCPNLKVYSRSRVRDATMCGEKDSSAGDGIFYKQIDTTYAGAYLGSGQSSVTYSRDEDGECSSEDTPRGVYCTGLFFDEGKYYTTRVTTNSDSGSCSDSADCDDGVICPYDYSYSTNRTTTTTRVKSLGSSGCEDTSTDSGSGGETVTETYGEDCYGEPLPCPDDINDCFPWDEDPAPSYYYEYCESGDITSETTTTYSNEVQVVQASVTYSDADSDADALDAAEWSDWSNVGSLRPNSWDEDRNGYSQFSQQEAEYAFVAENLVSGQSYSASVEIEECDKVRGQTQTCDTGTPINVSFIATDVFEIIGGILNSSVSRDDFVENEYSISPETYGLPEGKEVLESLTAFSVSFGEERDMNGVIRLDMD